MRVLLDIGGDHSGNAIDTATLVSTKYPKEHSLVELNLQTPDHRVQCFILLS